MNEKLDTKEVPSYSRMTGRIYDLIYSQKDYLDETLKLEEIIQARCESGGNRILEAACGTGSYKRYLSNKYIVDGFDLSLEQVEEAKRKLPNLNIYQADMVDFDTTENYDAVLCLFSSIGYLLTKDNLNEAISNFAKHTKAGGLVIVEPWLHPEKYIEGHISIDQASTDGLAVSRMSISSRDSNITNLTMHHLVGTADNIDHFVEKHSLAMFSDDDFSEAFINAGLDLHIDPVGLINRRLCIGKKPKI